MTLNRYAKRRDANETPLAEAARKLGLKVFYTSELGDLLFQLGGESANVTRIIEVKTEKGVLTAAQCRRKQQGLIAHVIRNLDDVLEQRRQMAEEVLLLAGRVRR